MRSSFRWKTERKSSFKFFMNARTTRTSFFPWQPPDFTSSLPSACAAERSISTPCPRHAGSPFLSPLLARSSGELRGLWTTRSDLLRTSGTTSRRLGISSDRKSLALAIGVITARLAGSLPWKARLDVTAPRCFSSYLVSLVFTPGSCLRERSKCAIGC